MPGVFTADILTCLVVKLKLRQEHLLWESDRIVLYRLHILQAHCKTFAVYIFDLFSLQCVLVAANISLTTYGEIIATEHKASSN